MIKSNLAPGHAKRVHLVGANQVDLPLPLARTRVPLVAVRDDALGNGAQPQHLGVVVGAQGFFIGRLFEHLLVLLARRGLDLFGRHQLGKGRLFADLHAFAGVRHQR